MREGSGLYSRSSVWQRGASEKRVGEGGGERGGVVERRPRGWANRGAGRERLSARDV
jgi:hypothetical protein